MQSTVDSFVKIFIVDISDYQTELALIEKMKRYLVDAGFDASYLKK